MSQKALFVDCRVENKMICRGTTRTANLMIRMVDERTAAVKPADAVHFETPFGCASVVASAWELDSALRRGAFVGQWKDLRYYEISAQGLRNQFEHRYLVLRDASTGQSAVQPIFFVEQDLTEGLPPRVRILLDWPRRIYPRWLRMRMLVAGCSTGEGALDSTQPWAVAALRQALEIYGRASGVALVLLKDFPARYRDILAPFANDGYRRVPSMPACELKLDFASFDEFMQKKIGRVFRQNLRRKFKKLAALPPIDMEVVSDATPFVDDVYALYLQTYERSHFRFEKLTREFLSAAGREMPDRARFFLWRIDGKLVAFALCMVHADTIYDLNIGLDYAVAFDLHLYFVTRRDILQWAMENNVRWYHVGPLNYHPKLHFRMELAPLDLYARHLSPWINPLFKFALDWLQPARHDPFIAQFPNAGEL